MTPDQNRQLRRIAHSLGAVFANEVCACHGNQSGSDLPEALRSGRDRDDADDAAAASAAVTVEEPTLTFPCLSLASNVGTPSNKRSDIKLHAAALLERPITVGGDSSRNSHDIHRVQRTMLENIYSSFDILIDARIRVYTRVLSSHGQSLLRDQPGHDGGSNSANSHSLSIRAIEHKLRTLLDIGSTLAADSVLTRFIAVQEEEKTEHEVDSDSTDANSRDDDDDDNNSSSSSSSRTASIPLQLQANVDALRMGNRSVSSLFQAYGSITGTWDQNFRLESVRVDVDADALLSSMMEEATRVVSVLVEVTNDAWNRFVADTMLVPYRNEEDAGERTEDDEVDAGEDDAFQDPADDGIVGTADEDADVDEWQVNGSENTHHPSVSDDDDAENRRNLNQKGRTDMQASAKLSSSPPSVLSSQDPLVAATGAPTAANTEGSVSTGSKDATSIGPPVRRTGRKRKFPESATSMSSSSLPSVVTRPDLSAIPAIQRGLSSVSSAAGGNTHVRPALDCPLDRRSSTETAASATSISSLVSEQSTSDLDAEKCATIVDFVIGEVSDKMLTHAVGDAGKARLA